jgi:Flp pilus assembly protein TadB
LVGSGELGEDGRTMSLLDKLRADANRESDPEIRRQRLAKIAEIQSAVQDFDRRLAAVKADPAEPRSAGRGRFFPWIRFTYGLGVVAALVGWFYLELPPAASAIALAGFVFAMFGVHLLIIKSRVKKLG